MFLLSAYDSALWYSSPNTISIVGIDPWVDKGTALRALAFGVIRKRVKRENVDLPL